MKLPDAPTTFPDDHYNICYQLSKPNYGTYRIDGFDGKEVKALTLQLATQIQNSINSFKAAVVDLPARLRADDVDVCGNFGIKLSLIDDDDDVDVQFKIGIQSFSGLEMGMCVDEVPSDDSMLSRGKQQSVTSTLAKSSIAPQTFLDLSNASPPENLKTIQAREMLADALIRGFINVDLAMSRLNVNVVQMSECLHLMSEAEKEREQLVSRSRGYVYGVISDITSLKARFKTLYLEIGRMLGQSIIWTPEFSDYDFFLDDIEEMVLENRDGLCIVPDPGT